MHREKHRSHRIGWLRAAVMGANDGLVSIASLIMGVTAGQASRHGIFLAGLAGWVAGAISMAAGEYVSVASQADTEKADLDIERRELAANYPKEIDELTQIYVHRGVSQDVSRQVAEQLMSKDALGTHARDELGLTAVGHPRPLQAALASALTFSIGAVLPVTLVLFFPMRMLLAGVFVLTAFLLIITGAMAAWAGGARLWVGSARVAFWGGAAMVITMLIGHWVGT